MKNLLLSILTLGMFFTSCSSDDNNDSLGNGEVETAKLLPASIASTYTEDGEVYKYVTNFVYDDRNRLVSFSDEEEVTNIIYEGDLVKSIKKEEDGVLWSNYDFVYNADGTVTAKHTNNYVGSGSSEVTLVFDQGKLISEKDITYEYDSNGNLIKYEAIVSRIEYIYDLTKKSIFRHCTTPKWVFILLDDSDSFIGNNLLIGADYYHNGEKDEEESYRFQWSDYYKGYPTKMEGADGGSIITYTQAK